MIDNDSEASKKKQIVNKMKEYFGEDKVLNVATFSKISSKTAIERACKGMGISNDKAGYLKSLIPVNRGKVAKLKDCIFGDKEKGIKPIYNLIKELKQYPGLQEAVLAIEGLITNRGTHAAGVIVCNSPYTDYIAAMRAADGTMVTCYDLFDAEEAGCIKFDMLTTVCADKIHKTLDYLLEHNKITWEGSLKATYYKWIHPSKLVYDNPDMWAILPTIYSVFQFDTPISSKALSATHPKSVMDLSAANSLLRLQPDNADETPIDKYKRYKESHDDWVQDTKSYGLNDEERSILWQYLADAYGLADSQEKIMRLSMDSRVSGYSLKEANKLRKSIAKKDPQLQAEAKAQFFEYGRKLGTRDVFLDYVWNVVFGASMGYSFSQIHSYAYSIIALQELNLNYFYPKVYWNCACLSCEALGLKDNEDGLEEAGATDYGEIAKAIYKMKQSGIEVSPPSINKSGIDFTPIEEDNLILFGLGGIASINRDVASQIIQNRPYSSFIDFYQKNVYTGSLVTPTKIAQLIKAGCFDDFETDRVKVMKQYVVLCVPKKQALTLANLNEALKVNVDFPKDLIAPYLFKRYVCSPKFFYGTHPNFKTKKLYWLDEKAQEFFDKNCRDQMTEGKEWWIEEDRIIVIDKELDKFFASAMNSLKEHINSEEFLRRFNNKIRLNKFYEIAGTLDVNHWAMEACSYYPFGDHELAAMNFDEYNIERFSDLSPEPLFIERSWGKGSSGRTWKQYEISAICGTVLARNDNNHLLTILTPENVVVNVKFNGEVFAYYKSQLSEVLSNGKKVVHDKPWFKRGELLIIAGYRRGDDFVAKRYKTSVFPHQVQKIARVMSDGTADIISERWGENSL